MGILVATRDDADALGTLKEGVVLTLDPAVRGDSRGDARGMDFDTVRDAAAEWEAVVDATEEGVGSLPAMAPLVVVVAVLAACLAVEAAVREAPLTRAADSAEVSVSFSDDCVWWWCSFWVFMVHDSCSFQFLGNASNANKKQMTCFS